MAAVAIPRPVYRHVRRAYQSVAKPVYARDRRQLAQLLGQFVSKDDIVFDIGANRGDYTDVLLTLGARVVAVEPNPDLARFLRDHFTARVIEAAVGAEPGIAELHLGRDPGHSTLSAEWLTAAPSGHRWQPDPITVQVTTLDALAEHHGTPAFVKIDVEGYEAEVLTGCTFTPQALSLEYQCVNLAGTAVCLGLLDGYEFSSARSNIHERGPWCDTDELLARLDAHRRDDPAGYGDVYARTH